MNSQQDLIDVINDISKKQNHSYDTPATVLRVDGDTVWVHIDGGADETPVLKTVSCKEGETVQVRIANGSAFLVGNASAPPTDDSLANVAHFVAEQAEIEAVTAQNKAISAEAAAIAAEAAAQRALVTYETWYILSATEPTQPTEDSHSGWSTTEPAWSSSSTDNLYYSIRTEKGDGTITWGTVGQVQSYADLVILKNAIISTVSADYVGKGTSGISSLSSTMYQNVNGVNIYNNTLAVGDSYAHIDGDSFDIKQATTAGAIDDANDTLIASFGQSVTVGTRASGSTVGSYSQTFGRDCTASGNYSHAEGKSTTASGHYSHAEGLGTTASGQYSHAEGINTTASKHYAHAEGYESEASGYYSHAEGGGTESRGDYSHAEGYESLSSGGYSHAEGYGTESSGNYSHAQNYSTIAKSISQTAIGKYNIEDSSNKYALIVGNGDDVARSNAFCVDWEGNALVGGNVQDMNGNNKTPTVLTSGTISTSTTSYTFSDSAIKSDSVIDIYDTIFGFSPTGMTVSTGSCTVTFPAQSSTHKIKLFIY